MVERHPAVPVTPSSLPSKSQLKKVGDRIRKRATGELFDLDGEQAAEDATLVKRWRSAHSAALTTTRIGLGTVAMRVQGLDSQAGLVTQRLKRFESIVAKLVRDKPRLAEIEDIAGCRSVVPDRATAERVWEQLDKKAQKLEIVQVKNYNDSPHNGGYRALHLWCRRDGFKVEVQLRTARQQQWAELVEEWDSALGTDLKHEAAPEVILTYFRELANYFDLLDTGVAELDVDKSALRGAREALETWAREV
ncbi:RelA/SpoT domain-containing protein [Amycolatopsis thermoflava]|uniref:RelA/SpoT domain-containing protein n=1 Tax=Amycolatopsis thermoflava TaxID=84480 RepID=UPI00364C457E